MSCHRTRGVYTYVLASLLNVSTGTSLCKRDQVIHLTDAESFRISLKAIRATPNHINRSYTTNFTKLNQFQQIALKKNDVYHPTLYSIRFDVDHS